MLSWSSIFDYFDKRPRLTILYLIFCLSFISNIYYQSEYAVSPAQARLLATVKALAKQPLKLIVIEPYDLSNKNFKVEISNPFDIKTIQDFLINSNTQPTVGGHVLRVYECTLTFFLKDGTNLRVLSQTFSDKPSAAYLSNNFYIREKDGTFTQWAMKRVYVPGLGNWLRKKAPQGLI